MTDLQALPIAKLVYFQAYDGIIGRWTNCRVECVSLDIHPNGMELTWLSVTYANGITEHYNPVREIRIVPA